MKKIYTFFAAMIVSAGLFAQTVTIYEIQGQQSSSPYEGQVVTTSGIVTGVAYNGYFIQDGNGAWNGIFVYDTDNSPLAGDDITLTGEVAEYYEMTELKNISAFTVNSQGNTLPNAEVLSPSQARTEDYEGGLVQVNEVTCIELPNTYGEWTAVHQPTNDTLFVDDNIYSYNPDLGETYDLTGCMTYSYGTYRLNPTQDGGSGDEVAIYEIQGQQSSSPYEGQVVTTSGIVTGAAYNGYFIQDGDGAWNGILVYDSDNSPLAGDDITLTGEVVEYYEMTELKNISASTVNSQGNTLPNAEVLSPSQARTEDYEGVLVHVNEVTCIELPNTYGEWTAIHQPTSDTLFVDDNIYSYNPALGETYDLTGCMTYSYGTYRLNPTQGGGSGDEVAIYEIQGQTSSSPYDGQIVSTSGIVTGILFYYTSGDPQGYYIQDGEGAWNGIYIYDNGHIPTIGDSISLKGEVTEYYGLTEIKNISLFTVNSQGNILPFAVVLSPNQANAEDYESVLIRVNEIKCNALPNQYGTWTGIQEGTSEVLLVDDMMLYQEVFTPTLNEIYDLRGIMDYNYSEYKLNPRTIDDINPPNGVERVNQNDYISIYPNPVIDQVNITSQKQINSVEIFNITSELKSHTYHNSVFQINLDVESFVKGTYILKVNFHDNSFVTQKITVK